MEWWNDGRMEKWNIGTLRSLVFAVFQHSSIPVFHFCSFWLETFLERVQAGLDAAVIDVAADFNAQTADHGGIVWRSSSSRISLPLVWPFRRRCAFGRLASESCR